MTALKQFERLEAAGLWRARPDEQRKNVFVSFGDASLTITDTSDRVLAHWSLGAVARANKGQRPAIYHPDGDPGETLELDDEADAMIDAIETVRGAIERGRPKPGKLRVWLTAVAGLGIAAMAVFWLPGALMHHTVKVVPQVKRIEIGEALLAQIVRMSGAPCMTQEARMPLRRLAARVLGADRGTALVVLRDGVRDSVHLPGGHILLNRSLIEDPDDPAVTAGYILAENLRSQMRDPLEDMLAVTGLWSSLRLLTTGNLPESDYRRYSEALLSRSPAPVADEVLLKGFDEADLRSSPYAYALDITGESTLPLIEADPHAQDGGRTVLSDADWVRLQGICGA